MPGELIQNYIHNGEASRNGDLVQTTTTALNQHFPHLQERESRAEESVLGCTKDVPVIQFGASLWLI